MTNIDNKRSKATDPKGRKLPKGMHFNWERRTYDVRITDSSGKRTQKSFKERDYSAAKKYLDEQNYLKSQGITPPDDKITVDQVFEQYCKSMRNYKKYTTIASYRYRYSAHIEPAIGGKKIRSVKKHDCQSILDCMYKKNLTYATIEGISTLLSVLFDYAVSDDILLKSPVLKLEIPRKAAPTKERPYLTADQFPVFLDAARHYIVYPALELLLETGLRIAELAGLKREDIDLEKKILRVERSLNYVKTNGNCRWIFDDPKTKNGKRLVPLSNRACTILRELFEKRGDIPRQAGFEGLIFCTDCGMPVVPSHYNNTIRRIREKTGLPITSVHCLRHTYISHMVNDLNVDPKILYKIVGHSSPEMIYKTYFHITDEQCCQEMIRIENDNENGNK